MTVNAELRETLKEGQKIASMRNIFGDHTIDYFVPEAGIVIGKKGTHTDRRET